MGGDSAIVTMRRLRTAHVQPAQIRHLEKGSWSARVDRNHLPPSPEPRALARLSLIPSALHSRAGGTALQRRPNADRYVVYGVVTEYCVRCAVLGLLRTGTAVELVTNAIQCLSEDAARRTLEEFTAGGGRLTTVAEVCR